MIENNDPTTEEYYVLFRDCSNQVLRDGNNGNPVCDLLPNDIASYVWWHLGKLTKFEQQATGVLIFQEFLEKFVKTPKKQNITTPRDSNIVYPKKTNLPPYVPPGVRQFARIVPLSMLVKIWRDNGCASPEVILRATAARLIQFCPEICVEHDEIFVKEWKHDWGVTKLVFDTSISKQILTPLQQAVVRMCVHNTNCVRTNNACEARNIPEPTFNATKKKPRSAASEHTDLAGDDEGKKYESAVKALLEQRIEEIATEKAQKLYTAQEIILLLKRSEAFKGSNAPTEGAMLKGIYRSKAWKGRKEKLARAQRRRVKSFGKTYDERKKDDKHHMGKSMSAFQDVNNDGNNRDNG